MRNPLLEDVKKRYPHTFKVTRESSVILEDRLGKRLPEAEIGYIAMYLVAAMERLRLPITSRCRILVACGAGVATTWLLVSRIRAELPEVEIVEVTSARELQGRKSFAGIDVVVCTTPVEVGAVPAVVVSPFLSSNDVVKLKSALQTKESFGILRKRAEHPELKDASLADLITAETTSLEVYVNSWQAAVDKAGALLLYAGAIEPRYIEAMKDMIRQHGPYMVAWPGVALLHARPEDGVRRLCMSLVVLRQPVNFGHPENDPVFIAIALGAVDNRSHLRALLELHELLLDRGTVDEIRTAVHKSKVLHLISSFSG
jgi:mannitol/fructose-specific phosphotransferase system IIA component (Ntr-type)/galactitol-specific phosphotransferase system IIB component